MRKYANKKVTKQNEKKILVAKTIKPLRNMSFSNTLDNILATEACRYSSIATGFV